MENWVVLFIILGFVTAWFELVAYDGVEFILRKVSAGEIRFVVEEQQQYAGSG